MSPSEDTGLSIGELAEATGASVDTLRYYEREGLIPRVERNDAGHRRFSEDHVRWLGLLDRLQASGMSIARMRDYARLADQGDDTVEERKALLREHAAQMRAHIRELQACLAVVDAKIDLYDGRLEDRSVIWDLVDRARDAALSPPSRGIRSHPGGG